MYAQSHLIPVSIFIFTFENLFLYLDEELGKLFKAQPSMEDVYVYSGNGPA